MTWREFIDNFDDTITVVYYWVQDGRRPLACKAHELRRITVTRAQAVDMLRHGKEAAA